MTRAYFRYSRALKAKADAARAQGKRPPEKRAPEHGTWWIRYTDASGQPQRQPTKARRFEEAERIAHEVATLAERQRRGLEVGSLRVLPCDVVLDKYLAANEHLIDFRGISSLTNNWLRPHYGKTPSVAVTSADCLELLAKARRAKKKPGTVRAIYIRGHAVFEYARVHLKAVRENPWSEVKRPPVPKKAVVYLGRDDTHALIRAAGKWRLLLVLACVKGLRKGELGGLAWSDFHWGEGPHGTIHVRRSWSRDTTKDKEERIIPIHPALRDELLLAYRASEQDLLFPAPRKGGIRAPNAWKTTRLLYNLAAKAEVELPPGFTLHKLRATFLTHLIQDSGGDVVAAQRLAGHSTPAITESYYVGRDLGHLASRMAALRLVPDAPRHTDGTQHAAAPAVSSTRSKKG